MPAQLRRDLVAGGAAGIVGGLVFWWGLNSQGMASSYLGLLGLKLTGGLTALHVLAACLIGAGFGAIAKYYPQGYAATISGGLLYGLLWWIAGPITLGAFLEDQGPTWSLAQASASFPSLIGHLLYGGITGLGFHAIVAAWLRFGPSPALRVPEAPIVTSNIVILGGGFGGTGTAQRLERILSRETSLDITLVSQSNYLLFTPMLAEVASGALEAQHISAPVRASCPNTRFRRAEIVGIDTVEQTVQIRPSLSIPAQSLPYDHLVLALGSVPNFFGLPGLEENSFSLKSLEDATRLRNHVITQLELADAESISEERERRLTFVVAGGGFAGTETVAELFDLVHSVLRFYPNVSAASLRFVLIHSRDRILPELGPALAGYAQRKLEARGIEFLLNTRVTGATGDAVIVNEGDRVPTQTLIWTAGNQPSPLLSTLPCERNRGGAVIADAFLQVKGLNNVWAVGDCAEIPDPDSGGRSYPPTAQHALREGKALADNIAASIRGKPLKPFRFRSLGLLVALGHRTGAAEVGGWRFSGLLAWFMWRSIYLSKLPGMEKKVRVFLDWVIDLFFPRDIVLTSNPQPVQTDEATTPPAAAIDQQIQPRDRRATE